MVNLKVYLNTDFICIHNNTFYKYFNYYQNVWQTPRSNTGFIQRLYSVHAEQPTTRQRRSRRPHKVATASANRGVVFQHVQSNRRRMAFYAMVNSVAGDCKANSSEIYF